MNRQDPPNAPDPDDTIDVLSLLLTIAENLWLLLLGPLLVGAIAFGVAVSLPKTFESSAVLKAEAVTATSMMSTPVLDAALRKLGYLDGLSEQAADEALSKLRRMASAQASKSDDLVTLKVNAQSPEAAQQLALEILARTFQASKPVGAELGRLAAEKAVLVQQATELSSASRTAQQLLEKSTNADNLGSVPESIASISASLVRIQESINKVDQRMLGLSSDNLLQQPSLSRRAVAPNTTLIPVFAALIAAFFLLAFVFIRQTWKHAGIAPQYQDRVNALKRRYGLLK